MNINDNERSLLAENERLRDKSDELVRMLRRQEAHADTAVAQRDALLEALRFYADPETYFAIAIVADPPCGDFIHDFDDQGPALGDKPGKRARAAIAEVGGGK